MEWQGVVDFGLDGFVDELLMRGLHVGVDCYLHLEEAHRTVGGQQQCISVRLPLTAQMRFEADRVSVTVAVVCVVWLLCVVC